jgi:hypothetical protein
MVDESCRLCAVSFDFHLPTSVCQELGLFTRGFEPLQQMVKAFIISTEYQLRFGQ